MEFNQAQLKIFFKEPKMPFENVHDFWLRCKPLLKMMNIFLGHFWILELTQKYLSWSHLNAIYILNVPNILKLFVELWNSSSNIHNNFQNLLK